MKKKLFKIVLIISFLINSIQIIAKTTTLENNSSIDSVMQTNYLKDLDKISDSTKLEIELYKKDLLDKFDLKIIYIENQLQIHFDSLKNSNNIVYDSSRINTNKNDFNISTTLISNYKDSLQSILKREINSFSYEIKEIKNEYSNLDDVIENEDFEELRNDFKDTLIFQLSKCKIKIKYVSDNFNYFIDSLYNTIIHGLDLNEIPVTNLILKNKIISKEIELNNSEFDSFEEERNNSNHFEISSNYLSQTTYRGRDNGKLNSAILSEVKYHSKYGFSVHVDTYNILQNSGKFDEIDLGINYEYEFNDLISLSAEYQHFWFNKNSTLPTNYFNNYFEISTLSNILNFNINPAFTLDFKNSKELSFLFNLSYPLEFKNLLNSEKITFEPTFTYIYGEQKKDIISNRIIVVKGKKVTVTSTKQINLSSVMDYEIVFPILLDYNSFQIELLFSLICPVNVYDESSYKPFGVFGINLIYFIR